MPQSLEVYRVTFSLLFTSANKGLETTMFLSNKFVNLFTVAITLLLSLSCSACSQLVIKDAAGIKACIGDTAKAEIAALEIKEKFEATSVQYKDAEKAYNDAAKEVNALLRTAAFDAQSSRTINVPLESYSQSPAAKALAEFLKKADLIRGSNVEPTAIAGILDLALDFAIKLVDHIQKENEQKTQEAIDRVTTLLKSAEMATFGQLSEQSYKSKYSSIPQPSPP